MVVSSGFHKGRLKIVYDPVQANATAEYNTAYTTIVDISKETDFTIDVGWGQATTWREHAGYNGMLHGTTLTGHNSGGVNYGNGTLSVYVVNELTIPNSTVNNDIAVNVFVKALDDFEVSVPTETFIRKLRFTSETQKVAPQAIELDEIIPHSQDSMPLDPVKTGSEMAMANKIPVDDPSALFHFGEAIGSFRQLAKRYMLCEQVLNPANSNDTFKVNIIRPHFPLAPGYRLDRVSYGAPNLNLAGGSYTFVKMTHLRYMTSAYAAVRGGVRYCLETSPINTNNGADFSGHVNRHAGTIKHVNTTAAAVPASIGASYLGTIYNTYTDTLDGCLPFNFSVNPMVSFELPFYSTYRFKPAKFMDDIVSAGFNDPFTDHWDVEMTVQGNTSNQCYMPLYTAAGEDFSCFWYLGPPIFYRELQYPTA
jgi:hypothetical protein